MARMLASMGGKEKLMRALATAGFLLVGWASSFGETVPDEECTCERRPYIQHVVCGRRDQVARLLQGR